MTTETPLAGCPVEPEASLGPCYSHGILSSNFQIVYLLSYLINTAIYVTNSSDIDP